MSGAPRFRRTAARIVGAALLFVWLGARPGAAKTEVKVWENECLIQFHLKKEFYLPDQTTLDAWIAEAQNVVNYYNSFVGPLTVDQQNQLQFFSGRLNDLQDVKNSGVVKTKAELEAKIQEWKRQIETKWNAEPYFLDCCQVTVLFEGRLRSNWLATPGEGTPGYDQIAIMVPTPGNFFRSSVTGAGPFNANGFSKNPYRNDLTGQWSFDARPNHTAPHEAGHELGLRDRYHTDPATGTSVSDTGFEGSTMGITGADAHLATGRVIVRTTNAAGSTTETVNHLRDICIGMSVRCPLKCCPEDVPVNRGRGRDANGPFRWDPGGAGSVFEPSRERSSRDPGRTTQTPRDASRQTTPSDEARSIDETAPGDSSRAGETTPVPSGIGDTTQGPGEETSRPPDTATGGGTMLIGDPVPLPIEPETPLVDPNAGFDKAPPLDTSHYETGVLKPGTEEIQYKKVGGNGMAVDTGILYAPTPEGMNVTTSAVATGQGANFRRWEITDIRLNVDGDVVQPSEKKKFYIEKASYLRGAAAVTITAISSQYRSHSEKAESGDVCPVTGEKKDSYKEKETSAGERAAMAAGMGLLASQAKGEIPAIKAVFNLTPDQAQKVLDKKSELQVTAKNDTTHQEQNVKTPLH